MNLAERSIGLFDSGIGGLTVVRALREKLPHESMIYIGDTLNVPFGSKPRHRLQTLSYRLIGYLLGRGVKAIVIACNTSTSAIFPEAQKDFQTPIIGPIRAGAEEAIRCSRGGRIGLLATEGTVKNGAYQDFINRLNPQASIIPQAAPGLVEAVEKGQITSPETVQLVKQYLTVFNGKIDTLILGCTHYPFLKNIIKPYLDDKVQMVDPAERLAEQVKHFLEQRQAINNGPGNYEFWATDIGKINHFFLQRACNELDISSVKFKQLNL